MLFTCKFSPSVVRKYSQESKCHEKVLSCYFCHMSHLCSSDINSVRKIQVKCQATVKFSADPSLKSVQCQCELKCVKYLQVVVHKWPHVFKLLQKSNNIIIIHRSQIKPLVQPYISSFLISFFTLSLKLDIKSLSFSSAALLPICPLL